MKVNILNRIAMGVAISSLSVVGMSLPTDAQQQTQEDQKEQKPVRQEQKQDRRQQQQQLKQQTQQQERVQRHAEQDQKPQQHRAQQEQKHDLRQAQRQEQGLSRQQRQKLISQQQQRVVQYGQHLEQQEHIARQHSALLQRQKRMAQFRFQEQYTERLRQQHIYLRGHRFDYDRDPYFYTASSYRYNHGGQYYETNEYGAKMLRQAVNHGYEEGFRAGKADRDDRWLGNYKDSYAYRDANYGYSGYYVKRTDYNHYFREGFRRGYEDGHNRRYRYGRFANGNYSMSDNFLSQILNFQPLR